ncbi:unnamed protein product [Lactuca saligna]|uniref:Reverse transcriptase zinc-binding domain-containing protein n=1 Tax=Lactuca saligna TaxID=75948 RepID=A0AA35ZLU1_LACSI|nr:unnamed protein product [Lactuca saligna]
MGSLKALNLALIGKWWSRLRNEGTSLWRESIMGIHNLKNKAADCISKKSIPGVWNNIAGVKSEFLKVGINFDEVIKKQVGNGDCTLFCSQACEFAELALKVESFLPNSQPDRWVCSISGDGVYHVNVVRELIDTVGSSNEGGNIDWIPEVPTKVRCFIWRAVLNGIPTACALQKRGINFNSVMCSYCDLEREDTDHALIKCPMAAKVWEEMLRWFGIPHP